MSGPIDAERILDAFLAPEADRLPDRVLDAALADIARTPQRRALRVPWRFIQMTNSMRAAAAVAIVAIVGVGVLALNFRPSGGGTDSTPAPTLTALPIVNPAPSPVAPGISGWKSHFGDVYLQRFAYPEDWSVYGEATRKWQSGDKLTIDAAFADKFASPEEATVGLWIWEMPPPSGTDVGSWEGLEAWAQEFCVDVGLVSCEGFADNALPMCLDRLGQSCHAALLVPTPGEQFAFVPTPGDLVVTVLVIGREDNYVSSVRYGGSVALLKSLLAEMDVRAPGPGQTPGPLPSCCG